MLVDDNVLLDELGEEGERVLEVAERRPLTEIDPNDGSGPTDIAANPAQVFLLAFFCSF